MSALTLALSRALLPWWALPDPATDFSMPWNSTPGGRLGVVFCPFFAFPPLGVEFRTLFTFPPLCPVEACRVVIESLR